MEQITGSDIKAARERKRMTQKELADELGVSMRTVGSWERGESVPRNRYGAIVDLLDLEESRGREYGREAMMRRLGALAKQRREELGLSRVAFAEIAKLGSDRTVKDSEFGERVSTSITVRRIEDGLGWKVGVIASLLREADKRRASTVEMEHLDAFDSGDDSGSKDVFLKSISTEDLVEEVIRRLGRLEWEKKWKTGRAAPDSQELYGMAANSDPSHLERMAEDED